MREWHVLVHVCREKNRAHFLHLFLLNTENILSFHLAGRILGGRIFISCFLYWSSRPWGVYGLRKVSWRDEGVYICRPVLMTKVRFVHSVHKQTQKKNIYAIDWPRREKRKLHTLCSLSSVIPQRIAALFHTQTRQSLGTSPEHTKTSIRTHLSEVLNVCAHYMPPFATAEEQDGHLCQLCWEYRMPLPACSTPK